MAGTKTLATNRKARHARVRKKISGTSERPRLTIFKINANIYAQIIDDAAQRTLVSCSSLVLTATGTKTEVAKAVGLELAKRALEHGVTKAKFDRGSALYHGRVKALADGLRDGGLQI